MKLNWKQRFGVVSGNVFEFYDIAVYAAISPYITKIFEQQGISEGGILVWIIFALRFLLRPLGGIVVGKIADEHGRKQALIFTSTLTGIATLLMACLPVEFFGQYIIFAFLILQMAQAFSFGGEYPTIINYLLENTADKEQSRISSMIVASSIVGVIISVVVVEILNLTLTGEEMQQYGWRIPLFIGAVNIAMSFWFRMRLPQLKVATVKREFSWSLFTNIFVIAMVGGVVFYIQNLSSNIINDQLHIEHFSLYNALCLFVLLIGTGWLTDKFSHSRQMFQVGLLGAVLLFVPSYYLLNNGQLVVQLGALFVISLISALILGNLATMLFKEANSQTLPLGLGYNVALSIFGGLSPLIVQALSSQSVTYVGFYAALAALPALVFHRSKLLQT
ncbi:MFS transporter [Vibrio proteolyticus]|uniref:Putative major facilitator superfamily transporter n=2 Tax=Vibrio TaxID=662 RepID=U2ZZK2_VIBPR|nr:MFS transporter [Vibrio proteolyticus]GAD66840.1 putative major facilitator superfamily transporter [Vibrio proteolyticus NBRC 13287]